VPVVRVTLSIFCFALAVSASEIREFSIPTLERLGAELSRRDAMAARASDLVLAQHPELKKGPLLEWVTDLSHAGSVYWIVDTEPEATPVYKVVGDRVEDIRGKPLPAGIQTRYRARRNAIKAVLPKLNGAYGAHYNFEVLNDPDGSGFLVYTLAATNKRDEMFIGGHFRITVSADGSRVERIDDLSKGLLRFKLERDKKLELNASAQAVNSDHPVETFVYSSYLYHIPMFVGTKDKAYWVVNDGKIHKFTKAELEAAGHNEKK
jgi:hypothetical protein